MADFFRQKDVFWEVRGLANLTERSAEPVRSISAERSAEPFGFGRTLLINKVLLAKGLTIWKILNDCI